MKNTASKKTRVNKKDEALFKKAASDFSVRFEKVMRDLSRG